MLAAVTLAALVVYMVAAYRSVKNREQAHRRYPIRATYRNRDDMSQPPLAWRVLGAAPQSVVSLAESATEDDVAQVTHLFPEANVLVLKAE
ncbi:MAG TPA: hypothetical protein VGG64_25180 [Pirellulales bacterium]|jgi:hypothetical protein